MYYFYVAIFGAFGAVTRYGISISLDPGVFPYNTLLVNVTGCFLLAMVVKYLAALPKISKNLVNGIGTGFIGSFTTFSAFSVEVSRLVMQGNGLFACGYIAASVVGGFLSAGLGFYVSSRLLRRKELRENGD